jgi:glutaredoxin 3
MLRISPFNIHNSPLTIPQRRAAFGSALASQLRSRYRECMAKVVVYTTEYCSYCVRAKALLRHKGVAFEEIDVGTDEALREKMVEASGRRTVPQIFINGTPIGGFEELRSLDEQGELDRLLGSEALHDR